MEAVVVSWGQVNHTMEELVVVFCDQLFLEGLATGIWKRAAEGRFSEKELQSYLVPDPATQIIHSFTCSRQKLRADPGITCM